ncbi:MAG: glycosidase [Gammaproteobacteria bacterium]|nr:glycosidase [Gammaproteobacteria bacterium]
MSPKHELFQRYPNNPILVPGDWPYTVNAVFNPGVTTHNNETLLLVRVEDRTGLSHFSVTRSEDGYSNWKIDPLPSFIMDATRYEETWGIEDPRITKCGDEYMIVYTGFSRGGPLVCLAATRDFKAFERRGNLMVPEDKDAALFPSTFDGRWALIHRPVSTSAATRHVGAHIWLSWSPDLQHWGDHTVLIHAREGGWWDAHKVGLGPPPMLTEYGWLLLYHGVRTTASGAIYRLGMALLDRDDPSVLLVRGNEWVFGPQQDYERSGDVPDVVFPCGWLLEEDQQTVRLYYGAADTSICVASARLDRLIKYLYRHCICGRIHKVGYRCPVAGKEPRKGG